MLRLLSICLLCWLTLAAGLAQANAGDDATTILQLGRLPAQGAVLDKGWKWQAGDNPEWAKAAFDDSEWPSVDPTKDIFEVPQIPKNGQISWLRLRLAIDSTRPQSLALMIQQAGASEIYLNGKLIHQVGTLSTSADQIKAFNPHKIPVSFPVSTNPVQVVAIRYAFQPNIRYATHYGMTNPLFLGALYPTEAAVSAYTNAYTRDRNRDIAKIAVFALLFLLFFTLFVFFPGRKAHLYFSVYAFFSAVSWGLISSVRPPGFGDTFYGINNVALVFETIRFMFMLTAVYATFEYKKGRAYWAIALSGIVALGVGALMYGWGWLLYGLVFTNLISIDITRVSILALRRRRKGAWILLAGCVCYLLCWFIFSLLFSGIVAGQGLLIDFLFDVSTLSIPLAFAVFLAYDFGLTNRVLQQKLQENETLAAEKQLILATQNETLERQVAERTAELNHSLTALQATQAQLIQKEKLASLGELTAGIAHEIQNPLNFVTNFSEVSSELLAELAEEQARSVRDQGLEVELVRDLQQNQVKITQHGQRASGIVRGMLEHARPSTGERTPTDLNILCDEYLRLAYQGQRTKTPLFEADIVTDFAPGLSPVNLVAADIGRVLLNLYSNAFYALHARQQAGEGGYQPVLRVQTGQRDGQVEIRVQDNGGGMSEAVRAKVFQPFFTTKPPGEGTGLGLSLSYDIIAQGHGGSLTVDSQAGEGSQFVLSLPV